MKRVSLFVVFALILGFSDFASAATSRIATQGNSGRMPAIPVATVGVTTASNINNVPPTSMGRVEPKQEQETPVASEPEPVVIDMREKEREACMRNNIGVGNTFVWASRYSDIGNYATMIEDIETPENNTCFVRVELKSSDPNIDISGFSGKYFEMGRNITCGSWADEGKIEQKILDAKKKGRTWATVGGAVGGAALGVGAMELFGNRLIGDDVMGQEALKGDELIHSQLLVLKKKDKQQFDEIMGMLEDLKKECESEIWSGAKPENCNAINYTYLLSAKSDN